MCSRILMSSSRASGNSFVPVYQFDFQSWMTPTRIPPGWTFWPISFPLSSCESTSAWRLRGALACPPRPCCPLQQSLAWSRFRPSERPCGAVRASGTVRPRMCSTTSRAFRGVIRTQFALARTSWGRGVLICTDLGWPALVNIGRVACSCGALHLHLAVAGMGAEGTRGSELAELVPDHLLGDEDRNVLAPVMDRDRVPDHLREDRRGPRPGANHVLGARGVHRLDAVEEPLLHERPLLR